LPLAGLRVADFTAFWAGPATTHLLAALGADVIKIESVQRPDGMRFTTAKPDDDRFYEWGTVFHAVNPNKRAVTLDLTRPEGVEIAASLIAWADVVIENFSARVMEAFGLGPDEVRRHNPRAVLIRMPAFGLSGPWRDRTGFAMTVEQASGMAWRTGYDDGPPMDVGGICDPLGGMHAVIAAMAALAERDRTGHGALVEVPLVEVALVMTAEQVLAYSEDKTLITRTGNHGPGAAPQGCYLCRDDDDWLAISVTDDAQWTALRAALGSPPWAEHPELAESAQRHRHRDALDRHLAAWCAGRDASALEELFTAAGVPAARVVRPSDILQNPQLRQRGFFERVEHEVAGRFDVPSLPFRADVAPHGPHGWYTTPAPTLGQHNDAVLGGLLGIPAARRQQLRDSGIIGERLPRR
jgi:crotonobetainyl-CoA:carnitine CoA-transferase CaiB-like acyl-CoA transferase